MFFTIYLPRQHLFEKYSKTVILCIIIITIYLSKFSVLINLKIDFCGKAEFSASLIQSSVFHDPSEIILKCWDGQCSRNISY